MTRILAFVALVSLVVPAIAQTGISIQFLEQWMIEVGARGGVVTLSGRPQRGYYRAYQCGHFAFAEAVIGAIPDGHKRRVIAHTQTARSSAQTRLGRIAVRQGRAQLSARRLVAGVSHALPELRTTPDGAVVLAEVTTIKSMEGRRAEEGGSRS